MGIKKTAVPTWGRRFFCFDTSARFWLVRGVDVDSPVIERAEAPLKRFCSVTPPERTIGKEFPAWQFVPPAPELIAPVLGILDDVPSSEIHAFWVCEAGQLNDMSPAEVLARLPFETRQTVHTSQWTILRCMRRVVELAELHIARRTGSQRRSFTAVWEVRFCINLATHSGRFMFDTNAAALGAGMRTRVERFGSTQDFAELVSHPCHINREAL
jgi:hypothetical protein